MIRLVALGAILFTVSCGEGKETLPPEEAPLSSVSDKQLNENARSIEQAAEEAVKLIEAEAKAETDAAVGVENP